MKRASTTFLQGVIVLLGVGALVFMLWEPHLEGRNAHATLFQIYFNDPFLACAYLASSLFFVALYQAFRLLGHIEQGKTGSQTSQRALRIIKYCALSLAGLVAAAVAYLCIAVRGKDDIAGGVAMGLGIIFLSVFAAAAADFFERF